jgi:ABC-type dipeptide/oligopeptide/nickel transport system permease component
VTCRRLFHRALRILSALGARALSAWLVLLVLSTLVFLALRLLPGDPATLVLGEQASEQARAALRQRLGFDHSLASQYGRFLWGLCSLDLGKSLVHPGLTAFGAVGQALGPTARLAGVAVLTGALAGVTAALLCVGPWLSWARRWLEGAIIAVAATPLVAFAPLATWLLAVQLRLVPLPGDPESGWLGLAFASGLLGLPLGAQVARIARATLLDLAAERFLDTARAKGAGPWRVWGVHALAPASGPILVVVATQLGALLGGAVVLERLFERPGLGSLMLNAYASRDVPVLEAAVITSGLLFVAAQAAAAALSAALDPRGRR